jgi:hypothetical protein
MCVCKYHSRFIPEGVADASQVFLRDMTGGKPIAV